MIEPHHSFSRIRRALNVSDQAARILRSVLTQDPLYRSSIHPRSVSIMIRNEIVVLCFLHPAIGGYSIDQDILQVGVVLGCRSPLRAHLWRPVGPVSQGGRHGGQLSVGGMGTQTHSPFWDVKELPVRIPSRAQWLRYAYEVTYPQMEISDHVGLEVVTWVALFVKLVPGFGRLYDVLTHLGARRTKREAKW